MPAKYPRVLGIQAEHQPDAQLVQAFQGFRVGRVFVLLQKRIVQQAHDLPGLHGDFHLPPGVDVFLADQEGQAVILLFQIGQQKLLGFAVGLLHVVDIEFGKVACNHPAGVLGNRQLGNVPLGLLKRREQRPVRLFDRLVQVLTQALLLDQNLGGGDISVNERGVVQVYLVFKFDEGRHVLHAEHVCQQRQPELLALALFIALVLPLLGKFLRRLFLLRRRHNPTPFQSQLSLF